MKLALKSVARFTRQMATYEDSFVDIRRALESLSKSASDRRLSSSLVRVRERIIEGYSLYEAFEAEGDRYPVIFRRMTRIGEESGNLALIYRNLADYLDQQVAMRRRFVGRLIYPCFMVAALVVVHSILTAVFKGITQDGTNWSEIERVFVRTFLRDVAGIALIIAAVYILRFLLWGRSITDAILLYVPPLAGPFRKLMLARFSLSMSLMTGSAIGLPEAITESGKATGNGYAAWILGRQAHRLEEGEQLTPVLRDTGLFPADFIDIIDVAEESGTLSESLRRAATHYAEDADMSMSRLVTGIAWAVYLVVAGIMVYYIITLYASHISDITRQMY